MEMAGLFVTVMALDAGAETDLGKRCICVGKAFNEAAPSLPGTITALFLMGMARTLKGHQEADMALLAGCARV